MARTVEDAALLLNIMVGYDTKDGVTIAAQEYQNIDYTDFLKKGGLEGKRLGHDFSQSSEDSKLNEIRDRIIGELEKAGATIVDVPYKSNIDAIGDDEFEVLMYEFKDGLNKYLANAKAPMKSLQDVIDFNLANEKEAMPHFKQELLVMSQEKGDLKTPRYLEIVENNKRIAQKTIDEAINDYKLDGIMGLTLGPGCAIDYQKGDQWADVYTPPAAAIAGYSHITVPGGMYDELPIGLSLFGAAFSEGKLIEMAYAYQEATKHRNKPKYIM
jgi:amidase